MTPDFSSSRAFRALFGIVCATALATEAYVVFGDRTASFRIEGEDAYDVTAFASGAPVSHAFLMTGDGLLSVSVRFNSDAATSVKLKWTLWRGFADQPNSMRSAFEAVESLDLRPGRQWKTLTFPRDGSSKDRWYTIQMQLLDAQPTPFPQVSVVASQDNPDRGGVLWVNNVRQPGSLFLRAERRGRTLYQRFLVETAPNLPAPLRVPAVLWTVVGALHWSLLAFAWAVISDADRRPSSRTVP